MLLKQSAHQSDRRAWRRTADRRPCSRSSASSRNSPAACASPTQKTVEIVEMVLAGSINKQIVGYINAEGGKADRPVRQGRQHGARPRRCTRTVVDPDSNIEKVVDLGFVGEPDEGRPHRARSLLGKEMIPVLAPVAPRPRRRHLQHQRRHLRRRHRRRAQGQAPAAPHRRAGRARQGQEADRGTDRSPTRAG